MFLWTWSGRGEGLPEQPNRQSQHRCPNCGWPGQWPTRWPSIWLYSPVHSPFLFARHLMGKYSEHGPELGWKHRALASWLTSFHICRQCGACCLAAFTSCPAILQSHPSSALPPSAFRANLFLGGSGLFHFFNGCWRNINQFGYIL